MKQQIKSIAIFLFLSLVIFFFYILGRSLFYPLPSAPASILYRPSARGVTIQPGGPIAKNNTSSVIMLASWEAEHNAINRVYFSSDESHLGICWESANGGEVWQAKNGIRENTFTGKCPDQATIEFSTDAFSPDGRLRATVEYFQDVKIYSTEDPSKNLDYDLHNVAAVSFLPDEEYLAIAMEYTKTFGQVWFVPIASLESRLQNLESNHSYGDTYIEHPLTIDTVRVPTRFIFSPNDAVMAMSFKDYRIQLWDVSTLTWSLTLDVTHPTSIAFSHDGSLVATGLDNGSIHLWDTQTGDSLAVLIQPEKVSALAFSPSGRILVSADDQGRVFLWGLLPSDGYKLSNPTGTALAAAAPTITPTHVSLPLPSQTPTSTLPLDSFLPMTWPVPMPSDDQIQEASTCEIVSVANARYPESMLFWQIEKAYSPTTACDWAVLATAYQLHSQTDDIPEEGKLAFVQTLSLNPAFVLKTPLFYSYITSLDVVEAPSFTNQSIVKLVVDYEWYGIGDPSHIKYHIEIRNADPPLNEMNVSIQIEPEGLVSQVPTAIDPSLIQNLSAAMTDFLPVRSSFSLQPCYDNSPNWQSQLTFQDGSNLTLNTYSSNMIRIGGPWQTEIDGQNYVQFSAALPRAFWRILDALGLPIGQPAAMFCDWVDAFSLAYP